MSHIRARLFRYTYVMAASLEPVLLQWDKKKVFLLQDSSNTKHQHVNKVYRAVMPDMFLQACMTSQRPSPSAVDSATTSTTIRIVGNVLQLYKGLV